MDTIEIMLQGVDMAYIKQDIIKLGEIVHTEEPDKYNLLGIGTCLAIFIFSKNHQYFSMAHTVLPEKYEGHKINERMPAKYTDLAIKAIINHFEKKGFNRKDLCCKIVGGGQIYNDGFSIGANNIQKAYESLKKEGIPLLSEDVGGKTSRSILSFNKDGTITIRKEGNVFII